VKFQGSMAMMISKTVGLSIDSNLCRITGKSTSRG
jgi:hypothetical protein